jgi:hypothetical protein
MNELYDTGLLIQGLCCCYIYSVYLGAIMMDVKNRQQVC